MQKPKIRMNRRAVSPIIATLLLVAIAVAAAVVTYTWVMTLTANQAGQSQTNVKIDMVFFAKNSTNNATLIAVRNIGSVPATVQTIMLFNVSDALIFNADDQDIVISPQEVSYIGITDAGGWNSTELYSGGLAIPNADEKILGVEFAAGLEENKPYIVRVVTSTGFIMEGVYYAPASFT